MILGLDGGGTKTAAVLADRQGHVLAECSGPASNFQIIGVDAAAQVLFSLSTECCRQAGHPLSRIEAIVAGLTGAGREADQDRMKSAFIAHAQTFGATFPRVRIESDARIALEGAFEGGPGIILIAGTGSIAFGKTTDGNILRTGGWGRLIGDEGGGYAMGRDGLNVVSKELDGRLKKTLLAKLVESEFGFSGQEKIIEEVYRNNFDLASLAPLVIKAAEQHDHECERILNRSAYELSELVRALTFRMEAATRGPRQKIPLAFIGSLLQTESVFSKIVKHKIEFSLPQISVRKPVAAPVMGAVLMARELTGPS